MQLLATSASDVARQLDGINQTLAIADDGFEHARITPGTYADELGKLLIFMSFNLTDARDGFLQLKPAGSVQGQELARKLGLQVSVVAAAAGRMYGLKGDDAYEVGELGTLLDGALKVTSDAAAFVRGSAAARVR